MRRVLGRRLGTGWALVTIVVIAAGTSCADEATSSTDAVLPSVIPADLVDQASRFVYDEEPGAGSFTILGLPGEHPFGSRDAAVELVLGAGSQALDANTTVRGGAPAVLTETAVPGGTSRSVTWNENDDRVTLRSLTLETDALLDLVDQLVIADGQVNLDEAASDLRVRGVVPLPIYSSGYGIDYGNDERYISVDVHPTSGDELMLYQWGPTEPATVEGREVLRFLADRGALPGYVFEYEPGLMVKIVGSVSDAELRAAVMSVGPVDHEQVESIPTSD